MKHFILSNCLTIIIMTSLTMSANAQTKIIAHRGYWQCEHSDENSLASLYKADEAKVYGSEFDVIITKDGIPVIHHDDNIDGKRIEDCLFNEIRGKILKNGESLPTLEQYLIAGKQCKNIRLILEIKPHSTKAIEDKAVIETIELVKKYQMENCVDYISFSMNICEQIHRLSPNSDVAYLGGNVAPKDIAAKGLTGIDYQYMVIYKHPEWIKESKELKLTVNVWTVNKPDDIKKLKDMGVDFITTNIPVEALEIVK